MYDYLNFLPHTQNKNNIFSTEFKAAVALDTLVHSAHDSPSGQWWEQGVGGGKGLRHPPPEILECL